jgi:hypothetical protein
MSTSNFGQIFAFLGNFDRNEKAATKTALGVSYEQNQLQNTRAYVVRVTDFNGTGGEIGGGEERPQGAAHTLGGKLIEMLLCHSKHICVLYPRFG